MPQQQPSNKVELKDVDLVYLWVDGNDPVWQAKRNAFIGKPFGNSQTDCKGRYANNDELKYSLRSIEVYAPWIRKIFIVTDSQTPEWLDTSSPKIQVVDHKEILPAECLPCFNSVIIEHFLYRIEGLSEHFLYANDDMFLNKGVTPYDFFTPEGFPIIRLTRQPFRKYLISLRKRFFRKSLKNYTIKIDKSARLVEKKYGIYYSGKPHHNIDTYLRSDFRRIVEDTFCDEIMANNKHHIRHDEDVQRCIISYVALAEKRGELRYVTKKESFHLKIHTKRHYQKLDEIRPLFFCMNDTEKAQDDDRMAAKEYLEKRFPNRSQFEKQP